MSTEKKYSCPRCGYFDPDVAPVVVPDEKSADEKSADEQATENKVADENKVAEIALPVVPATVTATIAGEEVQIPADTAVEHGGQTEAAGAVAEA